MRCPREKLVFIAVLFFFLFFNLSPASSFIVPERLEYDLKWQGIKAGTAVLEIKEDIGGTRIVSTAKSAKFISLFYLVDDRIESVVEKGLYPVHYSIRLKEGRHRRDKEIIFDRKAGKARHIDHLKDEKKEIDLPDNVFDPMSGFYHMRTQKLSVGSPFFIKVFDSKRVWDMEVKVLRKERIETAIGTFDTIVVKPLMQSEGIFYRKGEILIWLTDDEKKIPVRLSSKVKIGSIVAELTGGSF
jgi:hypothetical protein